MDEQIRLYIGLIELVDRYNQNFNNKLNLSDCDKLGYYPSLTLCYNTDIGFSISYSGSYNNLILWSEDDMFYEYDDEVDVKLKQIEGQVELALRKLFKITLSVFRV